MTIEPTDPIFDEDIFSSPSKQPVTKPQSAVRPPSLPFSDDGDFFSDRDDNDKHDIDTSAINNNGKKIVHQSHIEDAQSRYSYDEDFDEKPVDEDYHDDQGKDTLSYQRPASVREDRKSTMENNYDTRSPEPDSGSLNDHRYSDDEFQSDFDPEDDGSPRLSPVIEPQNPLASAKRTTRHEDLDVNVRSRPLSQASYSVTKEDDLFDDDLKSLPEPSRQQTNSLGSTTKLRNDRGRVSKISRKTPLATGLGPRNHTNLSVASRKYGSKRKAPSVINGTSSAAEVRLDVNELRQEVMVIGEEIENLKLENKVLKRNNILLSHQLAKREKEELELPNLYDRQNKEVKVLKDHLRRQQDRYDRSHDRLRKVERELRRAQKEEKRLEEKAKQEELQERDSLSKRLEKTNQQNTLCDEKIMQLERYVENLEKCHERQMAVEREKRRETETLIDQIHDNLENAKYSLQAKESDLEKFHIQRTYKHARSRMGTSLSRQIALSEPPLSRIMSSNRQPSANRSIEYPSTNHSSASDQTPNQKMLKPVPPMRALPPPQYEVKAETTKARPAQKRDKVVHEIEAPMKSHVKEAPQRRDMAETIQVLTPSPPAMSRTTPRSNRPTKIQTQPPAQPAEPKTTNIKHDLMEPQQIDDLKRALEEERRRAELVRTNMALNQSKSQRQLNKEPVSTQSKIPVPEKKTPGFDREDSWAGILKVQEKITEKVGKKASEYGSVISLNASIREQTFAIAKSRSNVIEEHVPSISQQLREDGGYSSSNIFTSEREKTFLNSDRSTKARNDMPNITKEELNMAMTNNNEPISKDSLDFGGYQPSYQKPAPRRRETTIKPQNTSIFGDGLDELNL